MLHEPRIMDSLTTTPGVGTSSSCERQGSYVSQHSTTPLLNSPPSVDDQTEEGKARAENGSSSASNGIQVNANGDPGTVQENGDRGDAKIGLNGGQKVKTEIEIEEGGDKLQQNGAHGASEGDDDNERRGTSIPMREEFRCRRFWFFYHDIRALTTSVSLILIIERACHTVPRRVQEFSGPLSMIS